MSEHRPIARAEKLSHLEEEENLLLINENPKQGKSRERKKLTSTAIKVKGF